MFTEKTFEVQGVRLNYDEGSSSGSPMVLLHGLTGNRQAWKSNLIQAFSEAWHQYVFDQRGHGGSGRPEDDKQYRLVDYAGDIAGFLRERVNDTAVVVGHSLGAINSIGIGAMAADHVRGLILIDPPLFRRNQTVEVRPSARDWFAWVYETTRDNPAFEDVLAACHEKNPEANEEMLNEMAIQIYGVAPGTVKTELDGRLLENFDLARALQQITCPTLLMYGEWDSGSTVRESDVDFVRVNLPHISTVKIENGTHHFAWERWDEVLPHLETFLEAL